MTAAIMRRATRGVGGRTREPESAVVAAAGPAGPAIGASVGPAVDRAAGSVAAAPRASSSIVLQTSRRECAVRAGLRDPPALADRRPPRERRAPSDPPR